MPPSASPVPPAPKKSASAAMAAALSLPRDAAVGNRTSRVGGRRPQLRDRRLPPLQFGGDQVPPRAPAAAGVPTTTDDKHTTPDWEATLAPSSLAPSGSSLEPAVDRPSPAAGSPVLPAPPSKPSPVPHRSIRLAHRVYGGGKLVRSIPSEQVAAAPSNQRAPTSRPQVAPPGPRTMEWTRSDWWLHLGERRSNSAAREFPQAASVAPPARIPSPVPEVDECLDPFDMPDLPDMSELMAVGFAAPREEQRPMSAPQVFAEIRDAFCSAGSDVVPWGWGGELADLHGSRPADMGVAEFLAHRVLGTALGVAMEQPPPEEIEGAGEAEEAEEAEELDETELLARSLMGWAMRAAWQQADGDGAAAEEILPPDGCGEEPRPASSERAASREATTSAPGALCDEAGQMPVGDTLVATEGYDELSPLQPLLPIPSPFPSWTSAASQPDLLFPLLPQVLPAWTSAAPALVPESAVALSPASVQRKPGVRGMRQAQLDDGARHAMPTLDDLLCPRKPGVQALGTARLPPQSNVDRRTRVSALDHQRHIPLTARW